MPFLLSHSFAGVAVSSTPFSQSVPRRIWWLAALCAAIPDFDYAWNLNRYGSQEWFAHRGITHTPLFATGLALAMVWFAMPSHGRGMRGRLWTALFLATLSHGILDALSSYGQGIPFLFPFSTTRYHFPWTPIRADPHGGGIVSILLRSIRTEILWIWFPGSILLAITALRRRRQVRKAAVSP